MKIELNENHIKIINNLIDASLKSLGVAALHQVNELAGHLASQIEQNKTQESKGIE